MRWFIDTEFNEDGKTIELISIAMVNQGGDRFMYAVSSEFDEASCNEWVKANVLPTLPVEGCRLTRAQIRAAILDELSVDPSPEFWADYASYDWVVLCQLFGRMVDLPSKFPMYCHDLRQLMKERGLTDPDLPPQPERQHDALRDAQWLRDAWLCAAAGTKPIAERLETVAGNPYCNAETERVLRHEAARIRKEVQDG